MRSVLNFCLLFPIRVVMEVFAFAFDLAISRFLVAAVVVGLFWLPAHLVFDAHRKWFLWPVLVLGILLCGLWEGCDIFTIRGMLQRWGLVFPIPSDRKSPFHDGWM